MARNALRVALVALLLVLAGCNGVLGGPSARTPDTAESTATPEPVPYPPGITDDGVADAVELVSAHQRAAANASYVANRTIVVEYQNGTRARQVRTVRHGVENGVYHVRKRTTGEADAQLGSPFEIWTNETVAVLLVREDGERRFLRYPEQDSVQRFSRERLLALFARIETTTTGTTRNGEPLVHLLGTGNLTGEMRAIGVQNIAVESFSAGVTPAGIVRSYSFEYEGTLNGEPVTVTEQYRLEPREKRSADRPEWVPAAIERTNESE